MKNLKGWEEKNGYLEKTFQLDDFVSAVDFVKKIVPLAEDQGHHPDLEIFSYNKVKVKLTTHDEGSKVTQKDLDLAKKINAI